MRLKTMICALLVTVMAMVGTKADAHPWRGYHRGYGGPRVGVRVGVYVPPVVVAPQVAMGGYYGPRYCRPGYYRPRYYRPYYGPRSRRPYRCYR